MGLGGAESEKTLLALTGSKLSTDVRTMAVVGLSELNVPMAAEAAGKLLSELEDGTDSTAIFAAFLKS